MINPEGLIQWIQSVESTGLRLTTQDHGTFDPQNSKIITVHPLFLCYCNEKDQTKRAGLVSRSLALNQRVETWREVTREHLSP